MSIENDERFEIILIGQTLTHQAPARGGLRSYERAIVEAVGRNLEESPAQESIFRARSSLNR
jgi:hypothetical protein